MKRMTAALLFLLFLTVACADDGLDSATTETSDTAVTEDSRDFATRVGDSVGTATSNADELRKEGDARAEEVNEAMDE